MPSGFARRGSGAITDHLHVFGGFKGWSAAGAAGRAGARRGGDDSVLRRVVRFFEQQGFVVRGVVDVAPELLAQPDIDGVLVGGASLSAKAFTAICELAAMV